MQNEKEQIKAWLKKTERNREWLASKCFVSKMAVDQWFKKVGIIPDAKLALIKSLMEDPEKKTGDEKPLEDLPQMELLGKMFISLTPEVQALVENEARKLGLTVTAYCSLAVEYCASNAEMKQSVLNLLDAKKNAERIKSGASPRHNSYIQENQKSDRAHDAGNDTRTGTELFDESGQEHKNENGQIIITGLSWEEEAPA